MTAPAAWSGDTLGVTYDPLPGSDISGAASESIELARILGGPIRLKFNGHRIEVGSDHRVEKVTDAYYAAVDQARHAASRGGL